MHKKRWKSLSPKRRPKLEGGPFHFWKIPNFWKCFVKQFLGLSFWDFWAQICFFHEIWLVCQRACIRLDISIWCLTWTNLSKRPSIYSLIHFYKRCVSKLVWIPNNPYSSFLRSKETPLESWLPEYVLLHVFGHIMLKTPVLVWSLKLSSIEPCEYLDGWPPGNTRCWRQFCYAGVLKALWA